MCIPTDNSSNNISIVCKIFYLTCIQNELEASFSVVDATVENVISKQKNDLKNLGIALDGTCNSLSKFYATCKQHKSPVKFRYITSTTCAVSKPLARVMKGCCKAIQNEVIRSCNMEDYIRKDNIKTCWIIDNNFKVRKQVFKSNRSTIKAKSVCSFDFDTLYTSLPHGKVKTVIENIIKDSFISSKKKYIRVTANNAKFSDSNRKYKGTYILDQNDVIDMFYYMIDNCYICFKAKFIANILVSQWGLILHPSLLICFCTITNLYICKNL